MVRFLKCIEVAEAASVARATDSDSYAREGYLIFHRFVPAHQPVGNQPTGDRCMDNSGKNRKVQELISCLNAVSLRTSATKHFPNSPIHRGPRFRVYGMFLRMSGSLQQS